MNRIKKFDLFLLERFPLLWHTKIFYMLFYSIFLSAVFYLWGYFFTNQQHINNRSLSFYFWDSYATLFLIIFAIIGVTFWALSYFKKNAVKNFYPLQRFYFTKLLFNFLIIFWSLTWPSKTFEWGVNQKVRDLVSKEELINEIKTINLANAFLPGNNTSYEIGPYLQLKYPNVAWVEFNPVDSTWNDDYVNLFESSSTFHAATDYIPQDHPEANNYIAGKTFQLLRTKQLCQEDPCHRDCIDLVTTHLRYQDLTSHKFHDLRNYSEELINPSYFEVPDYDIFQSYWRQIHFPYSYYDLYGDNESRNSNPDINLQLNQLFDKASPQEISSLVKRYERFLKKYAIDHHLETDTILSYLAQNPESIAKKNIVSGSPEDILMIRESRSRFSSFRDYQDFRNYTDNTYEYPPAYYVDQNQLQELYRNVSAANFPYLDWEHLTMTLMMAIAFSFLFILFSFSDLLTLLLAIPFGGILLVLNILCIVFLTSFGTLRNAEMTVSTEIILFMLLMYVLLALFYYSKKVHKRILNITFYLCFLLTVFFPHALLFFLDSLLARRVISSCGNEYTQHTVFFYWLSDPLYGILLPVAVMILFMKLIKPVNAKAD